MSCYASFIFINFLVMFIVSGFSRFYYFYFLDFCLLYHYSHYCLVYSIFLDICILSLFALFSSFRVYPSFYIKFPVLLLSLFYSTVPFSVNPKPRFLYPTLTSLSVASNVPFINLSLYFVFSRLAFLVDFGYGTFSRYRESIRK